MSQPSRSFIGKNVSTLSYGILIAGTTLAAYGEGWTDDGSSVRLTTSTDKVGIGVSDAGEKLHIKDGNVLLEVSGGEKEIRMVNTAMEGNPAFKMGRIVYAGDGSPEFRFLHQDDQTPEHSVFEFDEKGIVASVKPDIGSHFEGFVAGEEEPLFRLNSYPSMQLEFGAGGSSPTDVAMRRAAANTLSFLTGGAERARIGSSGNVGIGTTNLLDKVTIAGSAGGGLSFLPAGNEGTVTRVGVRAYAGPSYNAANLDFITRSNWGSDARLWIGRANGGGLSQNVFYSSVLTDPTGYPNQNTHTSFNSLDANWVSQLAVIYIGKGSSTANTKSSLYTENGAVLAASGGNVGIGTTSPSQKLHVAGNVTADNYYQNSDLRLKTDIVPLTDSSKGIQCLQGVTYRWNDLHEGPVDGAEGRQIGLIAQDVENCFPEIVNTDDKGYKSVAYSRLVVPLIEAMKDQQVSHQAQMKQIDTLRSELAAVRAEQIANNARLARLEQFLRTLP